VLFVETIFFTLFAQSFTTIRDKNTIFFMEWLAGWLSRQKLSVAGGLRK